MIIVCIIPYYMIIIMTVIMSSNGHQWMIMGMHFNFMIIGWIIDAIAVMIMAIQLIKMCYLHDNGFIFMIMRDT